MLLVISLVVAETRVILPDVVSLRPCDRSTFN